MNQVNGDEVEEAEKEHDQTLEEKLTRQVAKGGGITFFGKLGGKLLKLLFQILLTRVLGASAYGLYALGFNALSLSRTFSSLGLQNGVVRFGSMYRGEGDKDRLKGTILISTLFPFLAGVLIAILLFVFAHFLSNTLFHEPELTWVIRIFALSLPFYTLMIVTAFTTRVFRKMQYDVGLRLILHPLFLIICSGLSFLMGYGLLGVLYGFLFSSIFTATIGVYLLGKVFPDLFSGLRPSFEIKKLVYYSGTVFLAGFSQLLIFRLDRIMLGVFSVAADVGIYNAAAVMATQASIFLGSVNAIFAPVISDLSNKGKMTQLNSLFKTTTRWIFIFTFPVFLIFVLFSKEIMSIYGKGFMVGRFALIILGFAQFCNAIVGSSGYILIMTGYQKVQLANNLILGILNVVLNILLIPKFGILGAAIATGISIATVNIIRLAEVHIIHRIHPYQATYWKPVLAGLVTILPILLLDRFLYFEGIKLVIIAIPSFLLFYLILLVFFKLEKEDLLILTALKEKLLRLHSSGD